MRVAMPARRAPGFTLVEMIVVRGAVSILAMLLLPAAANGRAHAWQA